MFNDNIKTFINEIGLDNLEDFVNGCGDFDTYDKLDRRFFNRGKLLYYNPHEINLKHLRMIDKVNRGESLGDNFKGRLYQKRCEEFLLQVKE